MSIPDISHWAQLETSTKLVWVTDGVLAICAVAAIVGAVVHGMRKYRGEGLPGGIVDRLPAFALYTATVFLSAWVYYRWVEVNHFPSQTMSEVLVMFTLALVLSMTVLHHALGLHRRGAGWAIVDDVLIVIIAVSVIFTHDHIRGLVTAQRDLPPALQSYWFPPHLAALIFSYATLGIAAVICLVYFMTRFWSGVYHGGYTLRSQILVFALLTLVPFAHVVILPIFAVSAIVFFVMHRMGKVPDHPAMMALEKELDSVSFRAFAVGMPFLTAGLWMGAFWAQEAWANYWGWDSKENSALITWLIYVVYIHTRLLGGYRGEKSMSVLVGGALSVFLTFQVFGYLPDSQKSLHRYTDDGVTPQEGMQGGTSAADQEARNPK